MSESTITTVQSVASIMAAALMGDSAPYVAADKADKAKVRSMLNKAASESIRAHDLDGALANQAALDLVTSARATAAAPEIDFESIVAQRIADLRLAADMLEQGMVRPDGIESVNVEGIIMHLDSDTVGDDESARRIAGTKITRNSDRVDLAAHVAEVIADQPVGTFLKISQVANQPTAAAPNGLPSQGALAARLFAKGGCTLPNVEPVDATATSPKGLRVIG